MQRVGTIRHVHCHADQVMNNHTDGGTGCAMRIMYGSAHSLLSGYDESESSQHRYAIVPF